MANNLAKGRWTEERLTYLKKQWLAGDTTTKIMNALLEQSKGSEKVFHVTRANVISKLIEMRLYDADRVNGEKDLPELPPSKVGPQQLGKPVSRVPLAGKPTAFIKPQEPRRIPQGAAGVRFHSSMRTAGSPR